MQDPAPAPEEAEVTSPEAMEGQEPAPSIEQIAHRIKANYDFNVNVKPTIFHFKSQVDKDTGTKTKRESLNLAVPYPSVQGIIDILENEDDKETELLLDAVEAVITQHVRALITEDESINAENLPVDKLSWHYIAHMPKPERTGGGIPKETWEAFVSDYIDVMPEATGKTEEQVAMAAKILGNKFASVKTNTPVLELLVGQLAIYAETSEDIETFRPCVDFLINKADGLLNLTEEDLLAGL